MKIIIIIIFDNDINCNNSTSTNIQTRLGNSVDSAFTILWRRYVQSSKWEYVLLVTRQS